VSTQGLYSSIGVASNPFYVRTSPLVLLMERNWRVKRHGNS